MMQALGLMADFKSGLCKLLVNFQLEKENVFSTETCPKKMKSQKSGSYSIHILS